MFLDICMSMKVRMHTEPISIQEEASRDLAGNFWESYFLQGARRLREVAETLESRGLAARGGRSTEIDLPEKEREEMSL